MTGDGTDGTTDGSTTDGSTTDGSTTDGSTTDGSTAGDALVPRRWLLRAGSVAVAASGSIVALSLDSEPALAAEFDRESVAVTTHDGRVTDVTITPTVTMSWEGADGAVETCRLSIAATKDGSTGTVCEEDGVEVPPDADGSMTCDEMGTHSVIEDGPYERADFRARRDGRTRETTVHLTLDCAVCNGDGDALATTTARPSFAVRVTNGEVTVAVGGSMDPAVETSGDD